MNVKRLWTRNYTTLKWCLVYNWRSSSSLSLFSPSRYRCSALTKDQKKVQFVDWTTTYWAEQVLLVSTTALLYFLWEILWLRRCLLFQGECSRPSRPWSRLSQRRSPRMIHSSCSAALAPPTSWSPGLTRKGRTYSLLREGKDLIQ